MSLCMQASMSEAVTTAHLRTDLPAVQLDRETHNAGHDRALGLHPPGHACGHTMSSGAVAEHVMR